MLKNRFFYQWLLDLIIPYQILLSNEVLRNGKESGIALTIIDIGVKIHTSVIVNSILIDEKSKTEPSSKLQLLFNWMYKLRKIGIIEGKASTDLVRTILNMLVNSISEYTKILLPSLRFSMWENFLYIFLLVYEFIIITNFDKKFKDRLVKFDQLEKAEILIEIIQNLSYDHEQMKKEDTKIVMYDFWIDKGLFEITYNIFKVLWQEQNLMFGATNPNLGNSDDIKLTEDMISRLIDENKSNTSADDLKFLMYIPLNHIEVNKNFNVLKALINMICIVIKLVEHKNDVLTWVKELEKILLFIVSSCENSRIDENTNENFLTSSQECIAYCFIMSYNCLIDEMNSPRREEMTEEIKGFNIYKNRYI